MSWKNLPDNYLEDEKIFGIVYIIRNKHPDAEHTYYIGQKQAKKKIRRPPLKGKKRRRLDMVDNKLREYWGSSSKLLNDIEKYGEEYFEREVLMLCESKWEMNFYEAKFQFEHNVLFDKKSYNGIINIRIGKAPKASMEKYEKGAKI